MMSRRQYQDLAEALGSATTIDQAVTNITRMCAADNPRFNPDLFRAAIERVRAVD